MATTRRWRYYKEMGLDAIKLGKFASSSYMKPLARSCAANYAQTRRNILAFTTNVDSNLIVPPPYAVGFWGRWLRIPISGRVVVPGTLKVWIFASTPASEDPGDNIHCQVKIGEDYAQGTLTLDANIPNDPQWTSFTVNLHGTYIHNGALEIAFRTIGTNTLTIYSISAYQIGDATAPDFVDVSAGWLGTNDGPKDVFAMKLLRDNVTAVRGWKTPRANVFNHWYQRSLKVSKTFGANNDDLGHYKFVKRRGISELKLHFMAAREGADQQRIRAEIIGLDNAPAEGAAQDPQITTLFAVAPGWYTITWTINAADVDTEFECGLKFDGRTLAGVATEFVALAGFSLVESGPSASHVHIVPDVLNVGMNDGIQASQHENLWDTCHHLYYYGGRQILCSDWRHHVFAGGVYSSTLLCKRVAAFDKRSWFPWAPNISVIARAMLFSSTASQRIRVRMGYHTEVDGGTPGTRAKAIHICTTEVIDNAHCTHLSGNPIYEGVDDNDHYFLDAIDGVDGRPQSAVDGCLLEVDPNDDGDQRETHYNGVDEPIQAVIQGITDNADEYIVPDWVTMEEVNLAESEFP